MGQILTSGPAQGEFGKAHAYVREGSVCCKGSISMGRETLLSSALCKHKQKCSVVRWGRNLILDLGKEIDLGAARMAKNPACCLLGGAGVGFSAWPSLPSADSGGGAGGVPEPPTDAGGGAGAESTARMRGSSWGVEVLEIIPVSASKFCKWRQFLQQSKLPQPDRLVHLKSWLWLKMFLF